MSNFWSLSFDNDSTSDVAIDNRSMLQNYNVSKRI